LHFLQVRPASHRDRHRLWDNAGLRQFGPQQACERDGGMHRQKAAARANTPCAAEFVSHSGQASRMAAIAAVKLLHSKFRLVLAIWDAGPQQDRSRPPGVLRPHRFEDFRGFPRKIGKSFSPGA